MSDRQALMVLLVCAVLAVVVKYWLEEMEFERTP